MHPNSQIKIPFVAFSPQIDKNRNLKYFLPNKVIPIKNPKIKLKYHIFHMLIILLPFIASKYISKKSKNAGLYAPVPTIKNDTSLDF